MIAIIGTSDQPCRLAEACKILLLSCTPTMCHTHKAPPHTFSRGQHIRLMIAGHYGMQKGGRGGEGGGLSYVKVPGMHATRGVGREWEGPCKAL